MAAFFKNTLFARLGLALLVIVFLIAGFNDQTKHAVINTLCPSTLFPYARHTISSMVTDGGFPPLTLQPVNFDQLYAQRMQQLMNEQKEGATDQQGGEEIVAAEFKTDD